MQLPFSLQTFFFQNKMKQNSEPQNVVTVSSLSKSFGQQEVLRDISFSLGSNENLVVLGKSGSGKSVLIKCIVGLMVPDSGVIDVMGTEITRISIKQLNEVRKRIGFLFQSAALYDSMSVRQNLEFHLERVKKEKSKKVIDEKVEEVLTNVNLVEAIDKMPSQLSGGMRKRIGLARTLIMDPEIILYDEPTTGLDPITSMEICELIIEVQKKYKSASIIITHDLNVVKMTSNRLLMIRDGEIYAEGNYKKLKDATDQWIHSFLN
jgi:phospholipid/cholesterol/gamma-HCH transport system ATP-binding protein